MKYKEDVYKKIVGCLGNCISHKMLKIIFAVWALIKVFFAIGIIILIVRGDFFVKPRNKNFGNMATFPGVSYDMTEADYWIKKDKSSDDVLMSAEKAEELNKKISGVKETHMYDLENCGKSMNGVELSFALIESVMNDIAELTSYYDLEGGLYNTEFVAELAQEAGNTNATLEQDSKFLICTTETDLKRYPTKQLLLIDKDEPDEDINQLSSIRIGEPMVSFSVSKSGDFFYVCTSNCMGWVRAEDVAVCESKEEWLSSWKIDAEELLVVTGAKLQLEYSNVMPEVSGKELSMGTALRLVLKEQIAESVQERSPVYNYVVYFPVRQSDGSYAKRQVLIAANRDVSVGGLAFTGENIIRQAFKCIGNIYGWGGMLHSEDCSGYIRDIYKCFGLELPRNTTWQQEMPVKKYDMSSMSTDEKIQILKTLLPGTILFMKGHEMLYLGSADNEYYCISATGTVMNDKRTEMVHLKGIAVTPLTTTIRPDGVSWIEHLSAAVVVWE